MQRPMKEIIPIRDIEILIESGKKTMEARSLLHGKSLPVRLRGSTAVISLPEIDIYDVIVVSGR
jgi:hypothetical protein